jgi:hypothetical protein
MPTELFNQTRFTLFILPFFQLLAYFVYLDKIERFPVEVFTLFMAMPVAAPASFANPLDPKIRNPRSVRYAIDHASQDERYAKDLQAGLDRYAHQRVETWQNPEAMFVLISNFKGSTIDDPDRQVIYPVILQLPGARAKEPLTENLARIQWIDFRAGLRKVKYLGQLLPEPERLLKALAIAPSGNQDIYPPVVWILTSFFVMAGSLISGSYIFMLLGLLGYFFSQGLPTNALLSLALIPAFTALQVGLAAITMSALRSRLGGAAARYPLFILVVMLAGLMISQWLALINASANIPEETFMLFGALPASLFPLLTILVMVFLLMAAEPALSRDVEFHPDHDQLFACIDRGSGYIRVAVGLAGCVVYHLGLGAQDGPACDRVRHCS